MIKLKICGLRRIEDISYVNELKPDYVGFVLTKSKRQINLKELIVLKSLLNKNILAVGVFKDNEIEDIYAAAPYLDAIQLHGKEPLEYQKAVKEKTKLPIIKKVDLDENESYADYLMFDNLNPGSGKTFDWNLLKGKTNYFLAGGVALENIKEAKKLHPYCLDVSSSIETNGYKDYEKMKQFIKEARLWKDVMENTVDNMSLKH